MFWMSKFVDTPSRARFTVVSSQFYKHQTSQQVCVLTVLKKIDQISRFTKREPFTKITIGFWYFKIPESKEKAREIPVFDFSTLCKVHLPGQISVLMTMKAILFST